MFARITRCRFCATTRGLIVTVELGQWQIQSFAQRLELTKKLRSPRINKFSIKMHLETLSSVANREINSCARLSRIRGCAESNFNAIDDGLIKDVSAANRHCRSSLNLWCKLGYFASDRHRPFIPNGINYNSQLNLKSWLSPTLWLHCASCRFISQAHTLNNNFSVLSPRRVPSARRATKRDAPRNVRWQPRAARSWTSCTIRLWTAPSSTRWATWINRPFCSRRPKTLIRWVSQLRGLTEKYPSKKSHVEKNPTSEKIWWKYHGKFF